MDGQTELLFDQLNEENDDLKAENARLHHELAAARAVLHKHQHAQCDPVYGPECVECLRSPSEPHADDCAWGAAMRGES